MSETQHPQDQLLELVYGELPPPLRAGVEAHLATCAHCTAELAAMRGVRKTMAPLSQIEPAPDAGLESLLAYAQQTAARNAAAPDRALAKKGGGWLRWLAPLSTAAALGVGFLLVSIHGETRRNASEQSPTAALAPMPPAPAKAVAAASESAGPSPEDARPEVKRADAPGASNTDKMIVAQNERQQDLEGAASSSIQAGKPGSGMVAHAGDEKRRAHSRAEKEDEAFDKVASRDSSDDLEKSSGGAAKKKGSAQRGRSVYVPPADTAASGASAGPLLAEAPKAAPASAATAPTTVAAPPEAAPRAAGPAAEEEPAQVAMNGQDGVSKDSADVSAAAAPARSSNKVSKRKSERAAPTSTLGAVGSGVPASTPVRLSARVQQLQGQISQSQGATREGLLNELCHLTGTEGSSDAGAVRGACQQLLAEFPQSSYGSAARARLRSGP